MSMLKHLLFEARLAIPREKLFWDFVDRVDWTSDRNPERIKKMLMKTSNQSTLDELEDTLDKFYTPLHNYLDDKVNGVSDDGFYYLNTHIIGSGKEVYDAVMNDWRVAQKMIDSHSYEEGFSYIWPDEWDYKSIRREHWISNADDIIRELTVARTKAGTYKPLVDDLIRRAKLVKRDKHEEALKGLDTKSLSTKWTKILSKCGKPCRNYHYKVPNFFGDIKTFIVDF